MIQEFLPTFILRHRKENIKKCSLQPLVHRPDIQFFTYPKHLLPPLDRYVVLTLDAPLLTKEDAALGLLLVDATWNLASKMEKSLPVMQKRSLPPHFKTAYPRKQTGCLDPLRGLASIEALFIAYMLTGRDCSGLLDHYYWKETFLNQDFCDEFDGKLNNDEKGKYTEQDLPSR